MEADELSYCLHIVLRFELELALLEQDMPVEELPQQWNRRMQELLGIQPSNDAEGCLQDIHWAEAECQRQGGVDRGGSHPPLPGWRRGNHQQC